MITTSKCILPDAFLKSLRSTPFRFISVKQGQDDSGDGKTHLLSILSHLCRMSMQGNDDNIECLTVESSSLQLLEEAMRFSKN